MGRHRTPQEKVELRKKAIAMRRAGIGSDRIARELGIGGKLASDFLRGTPVPASLVRPQAKDELREVAQKLRRDGRTYNEIIAELRISKGSASLWLRGLDFPTEAQRTALLVGHPEEVTCGVHTPEQIAQALRQEGWLLHEIADAMGVSTGLAYRWSSVVPVPARAILGGDAEQMKAMARARWDVTLAEREAERQGVIGEAASWVGSLSVRELALVAATAYWCEGSKSKPWRRAERLTFMNMDPGLIRLWLAWLESNGVTPDRLRFRIQIHASGDLAAATEYWSEVVGYPAEAFSKPTIKRHNPRTVRMNTGEEYFGCLAVNTLQSRVLYQHVAGVWAGIVAGLDVNRAPPVDRA